MKIDEMTLGRKTEVNSLQDQLSERDRTILDLKANITDFEKEMESLKNSASDEAKITQVTNSIIDI